MHGPSGWPGLAVGQRFSLDPTPPLVPVVCSNGRADRPVTISEAARGNADAPTKRRFGLAQ